MAADPSRDDLEANTQAVIAACDGDARAAVRALLVANSYLERDVERLEKAVSLGYVRGRIRRPPKLTGDPRR
ncbi:MAG TPA: hypothetical protein VIE66_12375 [Methylocella sp.]|jgi:hypothetical protein